MKVKYRLLNDLLLYEDECITYLEKMAQDGVQALVEVGPGKVLNGLAKRIVGDLQAISVNDVASFNVVEEFLA